MMSSNKTIAQLYDDAHQSTARKQLAKYGNPLTDAPGHVPDVLERVMEKGILSRDVVRNWAKALGKASYGERGLTMQIAELALTKIIGHFDFGPEGRHYMSMVYLEISEH